jgi:hypothetical protein
MRVTDKEVEIETVFDLVFLMICKTAVFLKDKPDNDPSKIKNLEYVKEMGSFLDARIIDFNISPDSDVYSYDYKVLEGESQEEVEDKLKDYINSDIFNMIISLITPEILKEFNDRKKEVKTPIPVKLTQIAIHTMTQFFGDNKQLSMFSDEKIDAFSLATGLSITNRPDSYGVVLNQSQSRVLEGILKAFSDSNYKGSEEIKRSTALSSVYQESGATVLVKGENAPYGNIDKIPVVKLTQAQIIELSGHTRSQGDKQDVIEALSFLATNQFCFYWVRSKTKDGKPVKDKNGVYVKEEVMEVGTLFRVKTVRNEEGVLEYYEIHPSAPLLDQVNNYFLLVPTNWRDEVRKITGTRASSYTYQFLLWLRLQYEHIRRYNKTGGKSRKPKPFKISKSWVDVAIALKMPPSMYKSNKKRASKIIQDSYSVAIKLGYLVKVENNGAMDTLYLNEKYYPQPGKLT